MIFFTIIHYYKQDYFLIILVIVQLFCIPREGTLLIYGIV